MFEKKETIDSGGGMTTFRSGAGNEVQFQPPEKGFNFELLDGPNTATNKTFANNALYKSYKL